MATIFSKAWAEAQRGDYSCLFASGELYKRRYSSKRSGYSTPHRKLTPLEHSLPQHLMSFSKVDACSALLAVTGYKRYKRRILTLKKHAHNKSIAVLKNTAQNGAYMAPIQLFIEKVSNSYGYHCSNLSPCTAKDTYSR
jgi:hypothetical protein